MQRQGQGQGLGRRGRAGQDRGSGSGASPGCCPPPTSGHGGQGRTAGRALLCSAQGIGSLGSCLPWGSCCDQLMRGPALLLHAAPACRPRPTSLSRINQALVRERGRRWLRLIDQGKGAQVVSWCRWPVDAPPPRCCWLHHTATAFCWPAATAQALACYKGVFLPFARHAATCLAGNRRCPRCPTPASLAPALHLSAPAASTSRRRSSTCSWRWPSPGSGSPP